METPNQTTRKENQETQQDAFDRSMDYSAQQTGQETKQGGGAPPPQQPPGGGTGGDAGGTGGSGTGDDVTCTIDEVITKDFPQEFKALLECEMDYIDATRTIKSDLLKEQIAGEKDIMAKWMALQQAQAGGGQPAALARPAAAKNGSSQGSQEEAQNWYNRLYQCLLDAEADLKLDLQEADSRVKSDVTRAGNWAQDIADIVKLLQVPDSEKQKAKQARDAKKDELDKAKEDKATARIAKLTAEFTAADEYYKSLNQDKEALKTQLQEAVDGWHGARDTLLKDKSGKPDKGKSSEAIMVKLKKVQMLKDYVKQYQNQLIANYLSTHKAPAAKETAGETAAAKAAVVGAA